MQRNGFFGHAENILIAMISDERKHINELGLRRILKAERPSRMRLFKVPELKFDCGDYIEQTDWQKDDIIDSPLIVDVSEEDITQFVKSGDSPIIDLPRLPCHTQAVECCIKLVTEASAAVCGSASRDGFIRARLESRRIMAHFNTKAQYCVA